MSEPAKRHRTEVQIIMDGAVYKYSGIPRSTLRCFLTSLRSCQKQKVPWREALKGTLSKGGEAAAIVRGSRIKEGMTQIILAKKLGVPQQHISEIERGKRPVGKAMAKRLARVFRTDYRVFL